MHRVELSDAQLLAQDEDDRVVAVATARVHGDGGGLVDHQHLPVVGEHLQGSADHRGLVAMHSVLHKVIALWGRGRGGGEIRVLVVIIPRKEHMCLWRWHMTVCILT